jgi:hypothetical protein
MSGDTARLNAPFTRDIARRPFAWGQSSVRTGETALPDSVEEMPAGSSTDYGAAIALDAVFGFMIKVLEVSQTWTVLI